MSVEIRAGDVVQVTRAASVQFISRPIIARVIRVRDDLITYHGWRWLDVYQLDAEGDAVERRTIYVQPAGLRVAPRAAPGGYRGHAVPTLRRTRGG